jgi:hypothetical protein
LGDLTTPYKWSDEQVNQFINDAIADYSMHFPRVQTQTISCSDDTRQYDLSTYILSVISVEYPTGEDPPRYLFFREKTHPDFWQKDGYYCIEQEKGENDLDVLYISQKPDDGESIELTYNAYHAYLDDDDTDALTVPEEHLELIILYVRWATYQELATTESASPDPTTSMSSALEMNVERAERAYSKKLSSYKESASASASASAQWEMDRFDRIY